jgi:hypothetical protein
MAECTEMGDQFRFSGTPNVSVTKRDLQAAVNFLTNSFDQMLEQQLAELKKGMAEVNNQSLADGSLTDFRNWRSMWENYSTAQGWNKHTAGGRFDAVHIEHYTAENEMNSEEQTQVLNDSKDHFGQTG